MNAFRRLLPVAALGACLLPAANALADDAAYPAREIRMIVPWAAGGSTDIAARALQRIVADDGYRLIVENVAGGAATIGLTRVARAAPDGYTLGMGTSSTLALRAQGLTPLRVEDFTNIANASTDPMLLLAPAGSGITTLDDFLGNMKKNPGKVTIGTSGNNNISHIFGVMTARSAGVDFVHVP